MKKYLILFITIVSTSSYAQDEPVMLGRESFTFVQIGGGAACSDKNFSFETFPSIAVGKRYSTHYSALDIAFQVCPGEHRYFLFSAPRVLYLHYLNPQGFHSLYLGGGLSYSGLRGSKKHQTDGVKHKRQEFYGVAGELAVGYEFCRHFYIRPFVQLNLTQPMIAANRKGSFPTPIITASLGAGF